jgi:hypothetical protein
MNLVSKRHKDEAATMRRMGDGYHRKSSSEQGMPRIDHFDLIGCLDRPGGQAQTCSIKLCSLLTECPSLPMLFRTLAATMKTCWATADNQASM